MRPLSFAIGLSLIATVLWDAFETVVLPRTVSRRWRLARLYFHSTWQPWRRIARTIATERRRERFLAVYGPLSLVGLLLVWAVGLVAGFAALQWSAGSHLQTPNGVAHLADDIYMSGTTFFTLGLGDVHPLGRIARILTVVEGGLGFGFLAVVIAYFPGVVSVVLATRSPAHDARRAGRAPRRPRLKFCGGWPTPASSAPWFSFFEIGSTGARKSSKATSRNSGSFILQIATSTAVVGLGPRGDPRRVGAGRRRHRRRADMAGAFDLRDGTPRGRRSRRSSMRRPMPILIGCRRATSRNCGANWRTRAFAPIALLKPTPGCARCGDRTSRSWWAWQLPDDAGARLVAAKRSQGQLANEPAQQQRPFVVGRA